MLPRFTGSVGLATLTFTKSYTRYTSLHRSKPVVKYKINCLWNGELECKVRDGMAWYPHTSQIYHIRAAAGQVYADCHEGIGMPPPSCTAELSHFSDFLPHFQTPMVTHSALSGQNVSVHLTTVVI